MNPVRALDPSKDPSQYGYGSIAWKDKMEEWKERQEKMQMVMTPSGMIVETGKGATLPGGGGGGGSPYGGGGGDSAL